MHTSQQTPPNAVHLSIIALFTELVQRLHMSFACFTHGFFSILPTFASGMGAEYRAALALQQSRQQDASGEDSDEDQFSRCVPTPLEKAMVRGIDFGAHEHDKNFTCCSQ